MPKNKPKEKHEHKTLKFPDGFLWGTATSAHQVEGNNTNSDWWQWEQTHQPKDKQSGIACDQYNLFEQDFELIQDLGHNSHRLSVEWARIEPEEGLYNQDAIDHYKAVLKSLKDKNIKVMLTLHHFTNPIWFSTQGGWENGKSVFQFEKYVQKCVEEFKDYVDFWITINEPTILVFMGYLEGIWPPQKHGKWASLQAYHHLAEAHVKAYQVIHKEIPHPQVGIAHNVSTFSAFHHHSLRETFAQWVADTATNHLFYKLTGNTHDFLGLNYYFNRYISFNGEHQKLPSLVDVNKTQKEVSDLGWEVFPQGMFDVLMDFSDYHLPIYLTENGIASTNDDRRIRFLISYLQEIFHAISTGVDVRGYFYWSLLDNFEWDKGFDPRFGLIEIDYPTLERKPRPSAYVYQEIIKENGIPHHLLRLLGHTVQAKEVLCYKYHKVEGFCEHV